MSDQSTTTLAADVTKATAIDLLGRPFDMPPESAGFEARGAWVIQRMMNDPRPSFTNIIHPAAVVGNLGGESRLTAIQEVHPIAGRGGFGWEQATGSRRVNFEKFCQDHNWKTSDNVANYEFLIWELCDDPKIQGDGAEHRALERLKLTTALEAAVYTFEVAFERPSSTSDVNSRIKYAQRALAYLTSLPMPPLPPGLAPSPGPSPDRVLPAPPSKPAEQTAVQSAVLGTPDVINSTIILLQTVLSVARYYDGPIDGRPNDKLAYALQVYSAWLDGGAKR